MVVLDFETYYDAKYSLTKLTIPEYVHDPRFHVHGLAVRWPDGRCEFCTDVEAALTHLRDAFGEHLERTTVVCHNAAFDLYSLSRRYNLRPRHFTDTMLLAYHSLGRRDRNNGQAASLEALAKFYKLPVTKGNLDFMSGVRNPGVQQLAELADYAKNDVSITAMLAERLLPEVTRPEVELPILQHSVRLFTERSIRIDTNGIEPIAAAVRLQTEQFLAKTGATAETISKDGAFTMLLQAALTRTGRKLPLKAGKNGAIPATARKDPEMLALVGDDDPVVAALAAARVEKKAEHQKLARLDTLKRIAAATGGYVPPYLVYCGAHTGRFSGGGGFNVQNLGRSGVGAQIRGLLVARPGHVFVVADLAQIEARVTAWCANQQDMLAAFRDRRDLYSEFASRTLGREVRKPRSDDPPYVKAQLEPLRMVGKAAVLGLGFGMGPLKYMNTLRAEPNVAGLFDTGALTPIICRDIVMAFRRTYPRIPRLWSDLEAAARASADGGRHSVGPVRFERSGQVTLLWLPSGRALRYLDLRLEARQRSIRYLGEDGMESEFTPDGPAMVYGADTVLYGGKLTENIAQAIARDVLVEAILRLEAAGWLVLFHVHDEVVLEVKREQADAAREAIGRELARALPWADGLPLDCEVSVLDRYAK